MTRSTGPDPEDATISHRPLRSAGWFQGEGKTGIMHRSWLRSEGLPSDSFDGRPAIGIANSWSELTPCNLHLRDLAEHVKRGVWQAGGVPFEFPTTSIGEPLVRPTAMLLRNLVSMDLEETLRGNPLDGVVLLAGCDKTTPAYLMGAASADLPTVLLTGGPMLNGKYRGNDIGSGTSVWRLTEEHRAGRLSDHELDEAEGCMSRSSGHCMTMGTASSMACVSEALGMQLPGSATLPASDSRRKTLAHELGRRIVEMVDEDLRPSQILTRAAFENAIRVNAAIGGSTNVVLHLLALAGRAGVQLDLDDFDALVAEVPTLVNLMPAGSYLMEDFHYAGGLGVVLAELDDLIHDDAVTVTGHHIGENYPHAECFNRDVIRMRSEPLKPAGSGIAILRGNLAPNGAVIKQSAASPRLLRHRGRALVWDSLEEYLVAADDEDLDVNPDDVLVVRNAGPRGYPGMPEVGNFALPQKILRAGVDDMIRISDARMSGTSYGTIVLHVSPEAAIGGPLAALRTGDFVVLDVPARRLDVELSSSTIEDRLAEFVPPIVADSDRGYLRLFLDHVTGADVGADFDFLSGGTPVGLPKRAF